MERADHVFEIKEREIVPIISATVDHFERIDYVQVIDWVTL